MKILIGSAYLFWKHKKTSGSRLVQKHSDGDFLLDKINLAAVAGKYKGDILSAILDFEMWIPFTFKKGSGYLKP